MIDKLNLEKMEKLEKKVLELESIMMTKENFAEVFDEINKKSINLQIDIHGKTEWNSCKV